MTGELRKFHAWIIEGEYPIEQEGFIRDIYA